MERKQETKIKDNGSYIEKEIITQTPEDGFVPNSIMEPARPDTYSDKRYYKGYRKTVSYTTNDPRITRPFIYGLCGLFLIIGIILLLSHSWVMATLFILIPLFGFYESKKDIDAIENELKKKEQDVTIDSDDC